MFWQHHNQTRLFDFYHGTPHVLRADGDGGTDGASGDGGGGGDGGPPSQPSPASPDWASRFATSLDGLNASFTGKLDSLIKTVEDSRPAPAAPEPADLDGMTRQELAAHISTTMMAAFEQKLNETLAPLVSHLSGLQTSVASKEVKAEIDSLRSKSRDFNDWQQEMVALAKDHPTLTVTDLYHLARSRDGSKAATLDKKYSPAAPPPNRFGGLFGTVASQSNTSTPKVTGRESVEAAWREVSERHPVLAALENLHS